MSIPQSVAGILRGHVTLEIEGIDRMYLNVYVPQLQREGGVASFFRFHRGYPFASMMDPISKAFVAEMEGFAEREGVPVVVFRKGERKDDCLPPRGPAQAGTRRPRAIYAGDRSRSRRAGPCAWPCARGVSLEASCRSSPQASRLSTAPARARRSSPGREVPGSWVGKRRDHGPCPERGAVSAVWRARI